MSELRQDPITHDWVIINPERAKRPEGHGAAPSTCPFCPGHEHLTPPAVDAFSEGDRWAVRVVPNKFPALHPDAGAMAQVGTAEGRLWRRLPGHGFHEVIIDSPDHKLSIGTLPDAHVRQIVEMYLRRYCALSGADSVRQVVLFRNHGRRAGTSLEHPHSQIVAAPVVAPETRWRLSEEIEYFDATGRCGLCDVLQQEIAAGARIVSSGPNWITLSPYAARVPYHLQIVPRRHCPTFAEVEADELDSLAVHLSRALGALYRLLNDPDYNLVVVTPPLDQCHRLANHWFIDVIPRLTTAAGFELGSRIVVNVQTPEQAAEQLRSCIGAENSGG